MSLSSIENEFCKRLSRKKFYVYSTAHFIFLFLLAISQTQDVGGDAVSIIIFDHKVWHCTV
jgi:hypothetical protein